MNFIDEIIVFIEDKCLPCQRVLATVETLRRKGLLSNLRVINRNLDPDGCRTFGVQIFPATFINGKLAFYGEFSVEDAKRFVNHVTHE